MFLAPGLARVERLLDAPPAHYAFERPVGTSSSQNTVRHGYQPYNPAVIGKYFTVFRTVANFISVGLDGKTPAMRLGLAKQPLTYEDVLWPGETAARPPEGEAAQRPKGHPRRNALIAIVHGHPNNMARSLGTGSEPREGR